ncbi:MAG: menaquinone biosynthesis protein [Anaerolineaceae bacterium]|nr:menaquinone biosynthesis protein [Anaerolineaceae bacterium]
MTLNIGLIDYLNTMPFHYDLAERLQNADVHFERGVPSQLNRALAAGEIDLAPISAIEAARHAADVVVLPGLSIASLGAVKTVLLFSWASDISDLDGQSIALTDHSATSVALLKVLCRERYHIQPEFTVTKQHLPSMLAEHQGALVIGDDALVESVRHRALSSPDGWDLPYIYDLGDEWLKMTGLPFTFAVWAARRDKAEALAEAGVFKALYASTEAGLTDTARENLAKAYAARLGLPAGACRRYLRDLRYHLMDDDLAGLRLFLELALEDFSWDSLTFWGERETLAL